MNLYKYHNTDLNIKYIIDDLECRIELTEDEEEHTEKIFYNFLEFCENEGIIQNYNLEKLTKILKECRESGE